MISSRNFFSSLLLFLIFYQHTLLVINAVYLFVKGCHLRAKLPRVVDIEAVKATVLPEAAGARSYATKLDVVDAKSDEI